MATDPTKQKYEDVVDDEDEDSSSSEDDGKFGFWGAGAGSSGSLSKYMAKREKESKRDMKKELAKEKAAKEEAARLEAAKLEAAKEEAAKAEAIKIELARIEAAKEEAIKLEAIKAYKLAEDKIRSQSFGSHSSIQQSGTSYPVQQIQSQAPYAILMSAADLQAERGASSRQSREQIYYDDTKKVNIDNTSTLNNAVMAAYVTQAMNSASSVGPIGNRVVPRGEFDAEPELSDSIPASKVLRRIGAYRNWSDQEIQSDLNVLEFHRLRLVKDLRDLSSDGWKEIRELLPLVKDLLIGEINRGKTGGFVRRDIPFQNPGGSSTYAMVDTPSEMKNVRVPTSTPIDSPDLSLNRRAVQGRQW